MTTDGDAVLLRTISYFQQAAIALRGEPSENVATIAVRFGMLIALRHPEYAQAYYKMTHGIQPVADGVENDTVDSFVKHVPLSSPLD